MGEKEGDGPGEALGFQTAQGPRGHAKRFCVFMFLSSLFLCHSVQFSSVQLLSRVQLCNSMDCSSPGFPVHHQLLELAQTHVH